MKNLFIGGSPRTSIISYVLAAMVVAQDLYSSNNRNPWAYVFAVGIAVLGRITADEKKQ